MDTIRKRWDDVVKRVRFRNEGEKFAAKQHFYLGHQSMLMFLKELQETGNPQELADGFNRLLAEINALEPWKREPDDTKH